MKQEVLRLEQVTIPPYLWDIHMHIYETEIVALIGINALGIDELLSIMLRNTALHYGHVYIKDSLVNDYLYSNRKENNIALIGRKTSLVESMTVEENLFVLRKRGRMRLVNFPLLTVQMRRLLAPLGLNLAERTLAGNLTAFEKLVVQLVKAQLDKSALIILTDISTLISEADLTRLKPILGRLTSEGMTFLYVCNHHQEAFSLANRCYLMREGRIIKHLYPEQMTDHIIEQYTNDFSDFVDFGDRRDYYDRQVESLKPLVSVKELNYKAMRSLTFHVKEHETVVLLDSDNLVIDDLFEMFSNTAGALSGEILVAGEPSSAARRDIALVPPKPDVSLIFDQLSVLDNILFTSDHRIEALWLSESRRKALGRDLMADFGDRISMTTPRLCSQHERIMMVYQRIMLQKPKFLCVVQPFASIDMYQRISLIEIFDRLKRRGCSILILSVSLSDSLQIADRLIILNGGTVEREVLRSEFSQFRDIASSIPSQSKE